VCIKNNTDTEYVMKRPREINGRRISGVRVTENSDTEALVRLSREMHTYRRIPGKLSP